VEPTGNLSQFSVHVFIYTASGRIPWNSLIKDLFPHSVLSSAPFNFRFLVGIACGLPGQCLCVCFYWHLRSKSMAGSERHLHNERYEPIGLLKNRNCWPVRFRTLFLQHHFSVRTHYQWMLIWPTCFINPTAAEFSLFLPSVFLPNSRYSKIHHALYEQIFISCYLARIVVPIL